jgi:hypothetical protein
VMQWDDDPHVCIYFPGSDAVVHHFEHGPQTVAPSV